ncbi:hypothetical protein F4821DRAFT_280520 [Hypoxylon rubiginosum]|uniref:Uncharacterized protein n=1 Tax=Hypoxylon rubiginosum TaxID=110542 RepID=A0ACC0CUC7_9PEZI|nr:hypothetical protein F4821DRAFT_280520 [Hypoxylon rubiginosum]
MASESILAGLPLELWLQVIADDALSNRDLKALRLTYKDWVPHINRHLFRRIVISRLKEDMDKFEQISTTPHLAKHVQQLVWHELHLEKWTNPDEWGDYQFRVMDSLMHRAVYDTTLFWFPKLPRLPASDRFDGTLQRGRPGIINLFRGRFAAALDRMPELSTFISCSMPPERTFYFEGYPLRADLFSINMYPDWLDNNGGFALFMLPILIRNPLKIKSLHLATEITDGLYLNEARLNAFSSLTSIDLRISNISEGDLDYFSMCLLEAKELKDLSLCFERTDPGTGEQFLDNILLFETWSHLTSLQLGGTRFSSERLGRFCRRHEQLRHLSFVMCCVTFEDLLQLTGLQLDSITIRSDDDEYSRFISQERILAFVNGESFDTIADSEEGFANYQITDEIRTEVSIYDHHNCGTAAYFDSKLEQFNEAYSSFDLMEIDLDSEEDDMEFKDSQEKTYWAWGKRGDGTCYWRVDKAELADAETTFWKFTKWNGFAEAYGEDPLDYFSEWDSDAGDVATPTPYCMELHEFSFTDNLGHQVPMRGACRYNRYDNPWLAAFEPSETEEFAPSPLRYGRSYQRLQY